METYQAEFIDFLLAAKALKLSSSSETDFKLKSGRLSPYFFNAGGFNDGQRSRRLGEAYADVIVHHNLNPDIVFGPAYKGISLMMAATMALDSKHGRNVAWAHDRREAKDHGEVTGADLQKQMLVGALINDSAKVLIIDDVITTGGTKYEAVDLLKQCANDLQFQGVLIALDRQEVGIDSKSAILSFQEAANMPVYAIITTANIYHHCAAKADADQDTLRRLALYLRCYGDERAKADLNLSPLEQNIVAIDRSVIPACDVTSLEQFEALVQQTADNPKIGGYKIGFGLGLRYGLPRIVETARKHTPKSLIYDHQKAATDIPDTGKDFAKVCTEAGIDTIIIFPQAGPETQRAWTYHALDQGLKVIVGGEMTHPSYKRSEGGYIADEALEEMYRVAAKAGIADFVVPGNRVERIAHYKKMIEDLGVNPVFYSPGLVTQGGNISDAAKVAGTHWHAIVGRGIYEAKDMNQAALEHTSKL